MNCGSKNPLLFYCIPIDFIIIKILLYWLDFEKYMQFSVYLVFKCEILKDGFSTKLIGFMFFFFTKRTSQKKGRHASVQKERQHLEIWLKNPVLFYCIPIDFFYQISNCT